MIRKCRFNMLTMQNLALYSGSHLNSEKHSSGESTDIVVLDKTIPKCFPLIFNYRFPYPF